MSLVVSRCLRCRNYTVAGRCFAYFDGIPDEIFYNRVRHDKVRKDQSGDCVFDEIQLD